MRYQNHSLSITTALLLLSILTGCSTTPVNSQNHGKGLQVVSQAKLLLNAPYRYGGNKPDGFDCSGFVQYTHKKAGIKVPRSTLEQIKQIRSIRLSHIQPGDLIFFKLSGRRKVSHVGIYIGENRMIHAPSSGKRVTYASLDPGGYWRPRIIATGRFY